MENSCNVTSECQKPSRNKGPGPCDAHYLRSHVYGDPRPSVPIKKVKRRTCVIDPCQNESLNRGLCATHYIELVGPDSRAKYRAVHIALGKAAEQQCACGKAAQTWAYDHSDPQPQWSHYGPYSSDLSRYEALCAKCHKAADLERIKSCA